MRQGRVFPAGHVHGATTREAGLYRPGFRIATLSAATVPSSFPCFLPIPFRRQTVWGAAAVQTETTATADAIDRAIAPHFDTLRAFVDRRIAELSAEVASSVQLMGMSEDAITARITEVHAQIARLIAIPASGARNSGLELEAVVHATQSAADTILEAAEAIQTWLDDGGRDADSIAALTERVNAIFQACSFQDLTGQRIRRAIKQLQQVETMLEGLMPGAPPNAAPKLEVIGHTETVADPAAAGPDLAQAEIDRLLNG